MSISDSTAYQLPAATRGTSQLIHNLETSQFEERNIDQKPNETTRDKIGRWFRQVWFTITGAWGTKEVKSIFAKEHACIHNYTSTLADLITHISKTGLINEEWAELVGMQAESPSSSQDINNERGQNAVELPKKVQAFYEALKSRSEQIAGNDKHDPESVLKQADLIRAGLQEVADKIREHNEAHSFVKKPYIYAWWNLIVSDEIFKYTRLNLHKEISPEELLATGESPTEYLKEKLALYYAAIETNPSLQGFKELESLDELTAHVMEEVQQERGTEFQQKIEELLNEENIQPRVRKEEAFLQERIQTKKVRFETIAKTIKSLQDEISTHQKRIAHESDALMKEINDVMLDTEVTDYLSKFGGLEVVEMDEMARVVEKAILNAKTEDFPSLQEKIQKLEQAENEALAAQKQKETDVLSIKDKIQQIEHSENETSASLKSKSEELASSREKAVHLMEDETALAKAGDAFQLLTAQAKESGSLKDQIGQLAHEKEETLASLEWNKAGVEVHREKVKPITIEKEKVLAQLASKTEVIKKLTILKKHLARKEVLNNLQYEEVTRKQKIIDKHIQDQETLRKTLKKERFHLDIANRKVRQEISKEVDYLKQFLYVPEAEIVSLYDEEDDDDNFLVGSASPRTNSSDSDPWDFEHPASSL